MMRRTFWLWMLTLTLFILIPGVVAARTEAAGEVVLSRTLVGQKALRMGDRGPAVEALQRLLKQRGFDPIKIDGIFGPLTETAVRQAQGALGLAQDGLAGVQTTSALEAPVTADLFTTSDETPKPPAARLVLHAAVDPAPAPAPQNPAKFALTFNGAPDPVLLPSILETLERHAMKATFFVSAEAAEKAPALVAAIAAGGNEIGLNQPLTGPEREMRMQLAKAQRSLSADAGQAPAHVRPVGGQVSEALVRAAADLGLQVALWTNVAVTDHPSLAPSELAEGLADAVYPGAIIMVHQDRAGTVEALEPLLQTLAARGLTSVTLSELPGE